MEKYREELREIGVSNPLIFQVRCEVQRAVDHHPGGGRVQLQAEAGLQAGAGPQHHAGRHTVNISVRNEEQGTGHKTIVRASFTVIAIFNTLLLSSLALCIIINQNFLNAAHFFKRLNFKS